MTLLGFKMGFHGFHLALNWLYLGLFGFVFHRQNRHFDPIKPGDSCVFDLALFRNFYVFPFPPPVAGSDRGSSGAWLSVLGVFLPSFVIF
ncbi:MAG: hypothetical protein JF609_09305 [Verrucomicrobia bacterium]|nr:hypothetical protein [Verrucomicrobiota bacterium]